MQVGTNAEVKRFVKI